MLTFPPRSLAHKNRVRFGFRLTWPFANAGIVVFYLTDSAWSRFSGFLDNAKALLVAEVPGGQTIADRIVCELS